MVVLSEEKKVLQDIATVTLNNSFSCLKCV